MYNSDYIHPLNDAIWLVVINHFSSLSFLSYSLNYLLLNLSLFPLSSLLPLSFPTSPSHFTSFLSLHTSPSYFSSIPPHPRESLEAAEGGGSLSQSWRPVAVGDQVQVAGWERACCLQHSGSGLPGERGTMSLLAWVNMLIPMLSFFLNNRVHSKVQTKIWYKQNTFLPLCPG